MDEELVAAAIAVVEDWRLTWQRDGEGQLLSFGLNDLSACPYLLRGREGADPNGICGYGCREEPACHTGRPEDGWPMERLEAALDSLGHLTIDYSGRAE